MGSLSSPLPYGQRMIVHELERQAVETPDRVLFTIPLTNKLEDGFKNITVATFSNAVNRAAWFFESALEKSETFDVVGYLGPSNYIPYPI